MSTKEIHRLKKKQRKITRNFILSILFVSIIVALALSFLSGEYGFFFTVALGGGLGIIIFGLTGQSKIVEDSIPYDNAKNFRSSLKYIFDKLEYRMETEHNNVSEWKFVGDGWSGNVIVQLGATSAKVIGSEHIVEKLKKAFEAPREQIKTDTVTDIDGNTYLTIKIGEQWWMAENLKVTRYRNGVAIPNVTEKDAWSNLSRGAYCSYDNDPTNAGTYGYLYNWYVVNDPRGLAPEGWHIPSDAEWKTLVDYLGGDNFAGGKLKEIVHWESPNTGATNASSFSALPSGVRNNYGIFNFKGKYALFWSSTKYLRTNAWSRTLGYEDTGVDHVNGNKQNGFSVRCVRD